MDERKLVTRFYEVMADAGQFVAASARRAGQSVAHAEHTTSEASARQTLGKDDNLS